MTRREEIEKAAFNYINSDVVAAENMQLAFGDFINGAEWADNNVTQDDCSKAPKLTSQDYSNGRFGYRLPAGFEAKLTERELILTPEKPEYPKTYEECCKVMNYCCNPVATKTTHKEELIRKFQFLLMYRDAYWKIAGEEMGLGKPWKPDCNRGYFIPSIIYRSGFIGE